MTALRNRLRSLENRVAPSAMPKRVYGLVCEGDDAALTEFIQSQGWAFDPDTDMIIHLVPMEPAYRDGVLLGAKPCSDPEVSRIRFTQ
jgi:hypothetical protein